MVDNPVVFFDITIGGSSKGELKWNSALMLFQGQQRISVACALVKKDKDSK